MIDDGDDVRVALDGGVDHLHAIDARQAQIGDEDVEGELGERLDGALTRVRLHDDKPLIFEALCHRLSQWRLVLDEEQMSCGLRHLRGRQHFDGELWRGQGQP